MTERDWTVSPGELLHEWLDEHDTSVRQLAALCRVSRDELVGVLARTYEITPPLADGLARGTQTRAGYWLALERMYRDDLKHGRIDHWKGPQ